MSARHPEQTPLDDALWAARRTGKWLAEQLEVDPSQVSRWRRGVSIPSPDTQRKIAKLLKVGTKVLWPEEQAA